MPLFNYTALNTMGKTLSGQKTASSPEEVAAQLQREDLIPLDILLTHQVATATTRTLFQNPFKEKVTKDALHMFCRQMVAVLKSGVSISMAMTRLAETTRNKPLQKALQQIINHLHQGRSLHVSMSQCPDVFSPFFVSLIKIGESTGQLDNVFLHLAEYLALETDTTKKIKTALRYPAVVFTAIVVALLIINAFVIPAFASFFATFSAKLPLPTLMLMAISRFILDYWHWMLGGLVLSAIAFRAYIQTPSGRLNWAQFKLNIPILGWLLHRILLARFARLYSVVLRAGVNVVDGITLVSESTNNAFVAQKIKSISPWISRGYTISNAITKTGLFPPLVVQMITLGEETGSIDVLLDDVADYYQREIEYELQRLHDAIEPIMTIIMGVMVFILALGVFLPMWKLSAVVMHHH